MNKTKPQLLNEHIRQKYSNPALPHSILLPDAQRKAFISEAHALRQRYGERLWPFDFQMEWQEYALDGQYEKSCALLNVFYQFEPAFFTKSEWADKTNYVALSAKQRGATYKCTLEEARQPAVLPQVAPK